MLPNDALGRFYILTPSSGTRGFGCYKIVNAFPSIAVPCQTKIKRAAINCSALSQYLVSTLQDNDNAIPHLYY